MTTLFPLLFAVLGILNPQQILAADSLVIQTDWSAGAASGSTTSLKTGWTAFDSQDGNAVILSTALQSLTGRAAAWNQTDDSLGDFGFGRTGASFSSTSLRLSGSAAFVAISTAEAVSAVSSLLPQGRHGMGISYHSGQKAFFLFGGTNANGTISNQILRYDPASGFLNLMPTVLPTARTYVAAAYDPIAARIYIFGGNSPGGGKLADILEYDPVLPSIGFKSTTFATPRSKIAAVYDPATLRIYLLGGENFDGSMLGTIQSYDGIFNSLVTLSTPLPSARGGAAASFETETGKILLFGGDGGPGGGLDQVLEFSPQTSTWTIRSSVLPSTRVYSSSVYHAATGKHYVFGGTSSSSALTEIIEFHSASDSLVQRPISLPASRTSIAAAFDPIGVKMYLFGGQTGAAFSSTNTIAAYSFISSGIFTSSVFDTGNSAVLGALSYLPTSQFSTSVGMSLSARAGPTPDPGVGWSNAGAFTPVSNGGSLSSLGPNRYIQYRSTFTTTQISTSSLLESAAISFSVTAPSASIISSAFDAGHAQAVIKDIRWSGTFPTGTNARFQIRTAPASGSQPGSFGPWLGPTDGSDFYTAPAGAAAINPTHRDGINDRYFQYRAVLDSTNTLAAAELSSVTVAYNVLPASPTLLSLAAISTDSIVVAIRDNSINEDRIVISSGFLPSPSSEGLSLISPDPAGTGSVIVTTISALPPNSAVFFRIRARSVQDGLNSFFSNELSTFTLANPPTSVGASAVFKSSLSLTWNINGNPIGTIYEVSASTDGFLSSSSTVIPFSRALTGNATSVTSLQEGTTYQFRMRALNGNEIVTDYSALFSTATRVADVASLSGTGIGISSISFSWSSSGPSALYRVYQSSSGLFLSTTAAPSIILENLTSNASAAIRVQPFNATGFGPLSPPATAFSLAAPVGNLSLIATGSGTLSASWNNGGNSPETAFEITLSTDGFQNSISTPAAFANSFTASATTYAGLQAGTTYSIRVRTINADSITSDFVSASTQTYPGALSSIIGTPLGISSISWTWSNTAGPTVSSYSVFRGSAAFIIAVTTTTSFFETGLQTNTTSGIRIRASNASADGSLSEQTTSHTRAAVPSGSAISGVFIDSITVTWDFNGNPPETVFRVHRAIDGGSFFSVTQGSGTRFDDAPLIARSSYSYKVQALDKGGSASEFDVEVSTFLVGRIPLPPTGLTARAMPGGRIALAWNVSPSSTVVTYNLYYDSGTGTIDYGNLFAAIAAPTTFYNTAPLQLNTTYQFGLRAKNEKGEEEKNRDVVASALSTAAPWEPSAAILSPPSGTKVSGNQLTLNAGLDRGDEAGVARMLFQYRAIGAGAWTDVSAVQARHPNPASEAPFLTHMDVSALSAGPYELRVLARDSNGADDPSPPTIRFVIDPIDPDISESRSGASGVLKRVRVRRRTPGVLRVADGVSDFLLGISLSTGALDSDTDILRVETDPAQSPVFSSTYSPAGIIRSISLESGQTLFPAGEGADIFFSHLDLDGNNRVDGSQVRADNLRIASYHEASASWVLDFPSASSSENKRSVIGRSHHLSLFSLLSPAASGLDQIRVYPNPFRPNNGSADDGKPYSPADPSSGITFDGLPAAGEIRIYTVSGALVWASGGPTTGGLFRWDARNGDGKETASGVYFAVFTDSNGKAAVKKLAVIR